MLHAAVRLCRVGLNQLSIGLFVTVTTPQTPSESSFRTFCTVSLSSNETNPDVETEQVGIEESSSSRRSFKENKIMPSVKYTPTFPAISKPLKARLLQGSKLLFPILFSFLEPSNHPDSQYFSSLRSCMYPCQLSRDVPLERSVSGREVPFHTGSG